MSSILNVGELKHLIKLERPINSTDEYGFDSETWVTYASPRAKIEYDQSYKLNKEIWSQEGISTVSTNIFVFRYIPNVTRKDRVIFKDEAYQIYAIENINEQNRFIRVWANRIC